MKPLLKKFLPSIIAVIIALSGAFLMANIILIAIPAAVVGTDLYETALADAVFVDEHEIMPLVTIDENVSEVLLITFHRYPDSYPDGETVKLEWGEVWCVTLAEINDWYDLNNGGVTDWNLRFKQLIGLPSDSGHTHFTAMWVSTDDMIRPAYLTDIYSSEMTTSLSDNIDVDYREWFEDTMIRLYSNSRYPWTRLGYTYDWADTDNAYGLTEFLVLEDSSVTVEFTLMVDEFVQWLINN